MSSLIKQSELLETFGFKSVAALRKCLDRQRIPYFLGSKGKITTTIQALNKPLIGTNNDDNNEVEFV